MDTVMFVQFPHPGSEHKPTGPVTDWNRGDHARKFMLASGEHVSDGLLQQGPIVFWGEWEPQSRVVERYPARLAGGPRYLHDPYWQVPTHRALLKNTDPLVFADRFLYSNCRQRS